MWSAGTIPELMSSKRQRSSVREWVLVSQTKVTNIASRPLTYVHLIAPTESHCLGVLLESGADANFIDSQLAEELGLEFVLLESRLRATSLDGRALWYVTQHTTPVRVVFFFTGKKDNSLRQCIDYRGLNKITIKNRSPLPLIFSAFELLQGTKVFSKLGLRNAYHLVRIREEDEWKTTFNTTEGHWYPFSRTRCKFGVQC